MSQPHAPSTLELQPAPSSHEVQALVEALHAKYQSLNEGDVATYIPELAKANPDDFGIALVTPEGHFFAAGDYERPFTIQSISKPFTFGMAIEALGHDVVARHVGVEPSGDAFNSIELHAPSNRPFNPMVNSGAITVTALLHARHGDKALDVLLDQFSAAAGRRLAVDDSVYESE